jgi:hypothetical protein
MLLEIEAVLNSANYDGLGWSVSGESSSLDAHRRPLAGCACRIREDESGLALGDLPLRNCDTPAGLGRFSLIKAPLRLILYLIKGAIVRPTQFRVRTCWAVHCPTAFSSPPGRLYLPGD